MLDEYKPQKTYYRILLSVAMAPSVSYYGSKKKTIDVQDCLARVDELLLATPIRNGCRHEIRISPPSKTESKKDAERTSILVPKSKYTTAILEVPIELVLHILSFLPAESLGRLRRVCQSWRWVIDDNQSILFQPLCLEYGWREPFTSSSYKQPTEQPQSVSSARRRISFNDDVSQTTGSLLLSKTVNEEKNWKQIFASHWIQKKAWISGKHDKMQASPWKKPWNASHFDVNTWGEILDTLI
eukprot:m.268201 g.268201  ORF g.268201 m.268201 type:complete len:242 (-) comp16255_c1_seq7:3610-4335(-)